MWAELSEARLIPSLAHTRRKHINKLPRDPSALSSRCWRPPASPLPARGHILPGEEGSAAQELWGSTRSRQPRTLTPSLPHGPATSRAGATGTEPVVGVSRRG